MKCIVNMTELVSYNHWSEWVVNMTELVSYMQSLVKVGGA